MEIEAAKQLIRKYEAIHQRRAMDIVKAYAYYRGDNDIKHRKETGECEESGPSVLRNADNRIAFHFHSLLVNQKASYLFTAPPLFDVGNQAENQQIANVLGDAYPKKAKDLCIDASNAGCGWVHYWKDNDGNFKWFPVPAIEIVPIYTDDLAKELKAVLRMYKMVDDNGDEWNIYEYWNDTECQAYRQKEDIFQPFDVLTMTAGVGMDSNVFRHNLGAVPFIPFPNNNLYTSDLSKIKDLCDAYDKTFSGFVNDLEDVQQVIIVLTNYGGQDMKKLLHDLKWAKAVSVEATGDGDKSGISTLTIDIPVEARDKLLELTRKAIFDMGQGVDPQQQSFDRTSGEAMKFMYSLLELKAGLLETEFRLGFGELIRAICRVEGLAEPKQIIQTWTRTAIRNDAELAQMCQQSVGIVSTKTILKHHPFVDNADDEMKELGKEQKEKQDEMDAYRQAFSQQEGNQSNSQGSEVNGKQ